MNGNPSSSEFQRPITGSIVANGGKVDISGPNPGTTVVQISGTWTGTIVFEGSNDNITFYPLYSLTNSSLLSISNITANGLYHVNTNGFQFVQAKATATITGTANIFGWGSDATSIVITSSTLRGGTDGTTIGNNGSRLFVEATQFGTWDINNISGTISLPTGAATSANQTNNLQTTQLVNASGNAVAVKTLGSTPLAADYGLETNSLMYGLTTAGGGGYVPVKVNPSGTMETAANQSGTWNINNISGTISLPTGASTEAHQLTQITSLQLLDNTVGSVGAGTAGTNSLLIGGAFNTVLPTLINGQQAAIQLDSSARPIIAPLTNSSIVKAQLQDNDGLAITLGQKVSNSSVPVVLPSDQTITISESPLPPSGSKFSFGDVTTASSANIVTLYRTVYNEQTTNNQRSVASSSANDTSAGTGARTVKITYYDQTGAGPYDETVTLNGIGRVNTVATNICFIERMEVLTAGSTGSNVGIITLFTVPTSGGSAIGTIAATDNQTYWAHHYVPLGKTCYISGFSINNSSTAGGNGALFTLAVGTPTVANSIEIQKSDFHRLFGQDSTVTRNYLSPIQVNGPARVRVHVKPESNTSVVQRAAFDYIDN